MNEKEIAELRRRFRPDKSNITHLQGCFVNESREIVSQFSHSLGMMGQEDTELILSTIRRTLSGTLGKNLIFHTEPPMPAAAQKESFQTLLGDVLADECRYDVVQAVQDELCGMIAVHKESKETQPLVINKSTVKRVLTSSGVSKEHLEVFEEQFDETFGAETNLSPRNLVNTKQIEISTPDVKILVTPDRSDLLETRVIDGTKYILIRADEGVEVNGVSIKIG